MKNNPPKFSFYKKFLSGEAHYGFWDSVAEVLGFINTFFIVTSLSVTGYGVFQLLLSLYAIFSNFLGLGGSVVGNDILRFVGEGKEREAKRLFIEYHGIRLIFAVLGAIFMIYGATVLTRWYSHEVVSLLQPMAVLLVLEVLFSIFKALLRLRLHFGLVASRSSVYKIAQIIVLAFFFLQHSLGIREVIFSMIAGSVISSLLLVRPTIEVWRVWQSQPIADQSSIFWVFTHHGKWEVFQQFTSQLTSSLQPWVIKVFVNVEAVAIYSIALTMVNTVVGFLPTKTLNTLVPLRIGEPSVLHKIYSYAMKYIFIISIVFMVLAAVGGSVTVHLLFPKYIPSLQYFYVLLLYIPITGVSSVTSTFLVVARKQKYLFYQKFFKALTTLPMYFMVMFIGLWGLVSYQIVFSFLLFLSIYRFMWSAFPDFKFEWRNFFRFNEDDKVFIKKITALIVGFIKKKLPFLNLQH